jgi:hypothetical protein
MPKLLRCAPELPSPFHYIIGRIHTRKAIREANECSAAPSAIANRPPAAVAIQN